MRTEHEANEALAKAYLRQYAFDLCQNHKRNRELPWWVYPILTFVCFAGIGALLGWRG